MENPENDFEVLSTQPSQNQTVSDSPAAQRRERRKTFQIDGNATGSNPDPRISGSAIRTGTTAANSLSSLWRGPSTDASEQVLFIEDVRLMRTFSALIGLVCTALVCIVPFLGGDPILRSVLWGGSCFSIFTSLWVVFVLRDLSRYDQTLINIMALLSVLIAYSGVLYLGVFSPASLIILPAIYFFSRTQNRLPAFSMFAICVSMQTLLGTLIITDVIRDPGLFTGAQATILVQIATQLTVLAMYAVTFILARVGREVIFDAMRKLAQSERENQLREAAFLEVREDLNRVLGAGGVGHYSDRRLGSYKIGGIIGRGAMGEVYEAVHRETGQLAAAKVLHPHVLAKKSSIERFFREAKAASALQCEHSVRVFEYSNPDEPVPYIVMERLIGYDLSHHLRALRRLPLADVLTLVRQVGTVIDLAASKGIVHRDLKPQNLFLHEAHGHKSWKVLDLEPRNWQNTAGP